MMYFFIGIPCFTMVLRLLYVFYSCVYTYAFSSLNSVAPLCLRNFTFWIYKFLALQGIP